MLLGLTPDAEEASRLGAKLDFVKWRPHSADRNMIGRMVLARGGNFHALLDNGLVGYFTVDRRTAVVRDVNGEKVTDHTLSRARQRVLGACSNAASQQSGN